jgi:hypothetical protein
MPQVSGASSEIGAQMLAFLVERLPDHESTKEDL